MRYLVIKKENAPSDVVIWTKSQYQVPVKLGVTRECSHRDYLRKNNIPFEDVSSVGMIYRDLNSGRTEVSVLPWDTPAPEGDTVLVKSALKNFIQEHSELKSDIQYDWNEYQAWIKRREELLGRK